MDEFLQALTRTNNPPNPTATFALLPDLEDLDIIMSVVSPSSLFEFVATRWRGPDSICSLKCVQLLRCMVPDNVRNGTSRRRRIPGFRLYDDQYRLPAELMALHKFVEEGFRLVIDNE